MVQMLIRYCKKCGYLTEFCKCPQTNESELSGLLACIEELIEIIKNYHKEEYCDHDVGICYCGEYSALDNADRLLQEYKTS